MQTEYEHIYFEKAAGKPRTSVHECRDHRMDDLLGVVKWDNRFRQYSFFPCGAYETRHTASCLRDIANFIEQLSKARKRKTSTKKG